MSQSKMNSTIWPALPYEAWKDTCSTLHLYMQVIGKIRLSLTPWLNHSWHVTLYPTVRGFTTSLIPYKDQAFQIDFDFIDHFLLIRTSDGKESKLYLQGQAVADFYSSVLSLLDKLGIQVRINEHPNEVMDPIPFSQDQTHSTYDPEYATRFWRVMLHIDRVFNQFRTQFLGKCSPTHFFWGSFDLALTRFSGRHAPPHPGGVPALPDAVTREAYSHEVSSAGFWPGGPSMPSAIFYSYAYPVPVGFNTETVRPEAAFFHQELGEFILPYEAVQTAPNPDEVLLEFLQSTYDAAAKTGNWDRNNLDCPRGALGVPRAVS